jgi:hypothetical protein
MRRSSPAFCAHGPSIRFARAGCNPSIRWLRADHPMTMLNDFVTGGGERMTLTSSKVFLLSSFTVLAAPAAECGSPGGTGGASGGTGGGRSPEAIIAAAQTPDGRAIPQPSINGHCPDVVALLGFWSCTTIGDQCSYVANGATHRCACQRVDGEGQSPAWTCN